jgi:hypothetical protein
MPRMPSCALAAYGAHIKLPIACLSQMARHPALYAWPAPRGPVIRLHAGRHGGRPCCTQQDLCWPHPGGRCHCWGSTAFLCCECGSGKDPHRQPACHAPRSTMAACADAPAAPAVAPEGVPPPAPAPAPPPSSFVAFADNDYELKVPSDFKYLETQVPYVGGWGSDCKAVPCWPQH